MGNTCSSNVNSASSFLKAARYDFSQCQRTIEGILVDPTVDQLARSLEPGSSWALDVSYDDQDLCVSLGWRPRATTLELVCMLFGKNGQKLGELSSHFVPFVRNKIRYEKTFGSGANGNIDHEARIGLPSDDRFKVHFRLRDFEDDLHVICFALRAPDRQRLCDARDVYAKIVEKSVDRGDKLVCLAHTGHLPVLSNNCVIIATLARSLEKQEWSFESIGLCLPVHLLEKWIRQPWCIDPDAEDFSSSAPLAKSVEKQRSTVEMVNEIAHLEDHLKKLKTARSVEHIKAGLSPDPDKKAGLHVSGADAPSTPSPNARRSIDVSDFQQPHEDPHKMRRRKRSVNEQHSWGEAGRIGEKITGPRANVQPITHFDMYDPISPTTAAQVQEQHMTRTPGDPDDDLFLACQSDGEDQKEEALQRRRSSAQQRGLSDHVMVESSGETVLHEAFPRRSEPSEMSSSDGKGAGSPGSPQGIIKKKSVSFSGDSDAAGAAAQEIRNAESSRAIQKVVHQPEPTSASSTSSSPPRGSARSSEQPRGSRQESSRGSQGSAARPSAASASSSSQGLSAATSALAKSRSPSGSAASSSSDASPDPKHSAQLKAAPKRSSVSSSGRKSKGSDSRPLGATAKAGAGTTPVSQAGGVSTGAAVAGGAVAGAVVSTAALAAMSEEDQIRELMRMTAPENEQNPENPEEDIDDDEYFDDWEEGEEEEYLYEGEEEEDMDDMQ